MNTLWLKWTLHCALGELLGIACAGGIAYLVNTFIVEPQTITSKLLTLFAMLFAGLIEGTILGWLQWKVLVKKFTNIPQREWIFYTTLVAVLGWFLGMLPSIFLPTHITEYGETSESQDFSNPYVFALLSIISGLVLGAVFGLFQWFSLKKYADKAYKWIIANSLGWGLGLGWVYLFASFPTAKSSILFIISMGVFGGVLAGLSIGAITGIYLIKLQKIFKPLA